MIENTAFGKLFRGLQWRMRHYRAVLGQRNPSTDAVLTDLAKYCRFFSTTHEPGQSHDDMLILEGRRQVFLRLLQHLKLPGEELFAILSGLDDATRLALFSNSHHAPVNPLET